MLKAAVPVIFSNPVVKKHIIPQILAELPEGVPNKTLAAIDSALPEVEFKQFSFDPQGKRDVVTRSTADFKQGLYSLHFFPGAFTPTCTGVHLADLVKNYPELNEKVNIVIVTPDSPDVTHTWLKEALLKAEWLKNSPDLKNPGIVEKYFKYVPDITLEFTNALGLLTENPRLGLVPKRAHALIGNGIITAFSCQENAAQCDLVTAKTVLEQINQRSKPRL